jgi:hypothetical protein
MQDKHDKKFPLKKEIKKMIMSFLFQCRKMVMFKGMSQVTLHRPQLAHSSTQHPGLTILLPC